MSKRSIYLSPVAVLVALQLAACAPQRGNSSYSRVRGSSDQSTSSDNTATNANRFADNTNKPSSLGLPEKPITPVAPSVTPPAATPASFGESVSAPVAPQSSPQAAPVVVADPESKKQDSSSKSNATSNEAGTASPSAKPLTAKLDPVAPTATTSTATESPGASAEKPRKTQVRSFSDQPQSTGPTKATQTDDPDQAGLSLEERESKKLEILSRQDFTSAENILRDSKYFYDLLSYRIPMKSLTETSRRFGAAYEYAKGLLASGNRSKTDLSKSFQEIHDSLALTTPQLQSMMSTQSKFLSSEGSTLLTWLGKLQQILSGGGGTPPATPERLQTLAENGPGKISALKPLLTYEELDKYLGKPLSLANRAIVAMRVTGPSKQTHDALRAVVAELKKHDAEFNTLMTARDNKGPIEELLRWRGELEDYLKTAI